MVCFVFWKEAKTRQLPCGLNMVGLNQGTWDLSKVSVCFLWHHERPLPSTGIHFRNSCPVNENATCTKFLCVPVMIMLDWTMNQPTWHWTLPRLAGVSATMSSPTSTPGSRKRGRNATPGTRKFTCLMQVASWDDAFSLLGWLVQCVCVISASSEGPISPLSQRRRGHDSSAGDLMPMPTSPATDGLSPAAPQDTSLFSSPRLSGPNNTTTWAFWRNYIVWRCLYVPSLIGGAYFVCFFSSL